MPLQSGTSLGPYQIDAALSHPHVCTLHDIGSQDGIDFLVKAYLEGQTLAKR